MHNLPITSEQRVIATCNL